MFEEENKSFGEKLKGYFYSFLEFVGFCIVCIFVAYFLVGCSYHKDIGDSTGQKESAEIQDLVINNDFKEPAHVVIIDENGNVDFEYYGIVNTTEKDGQTNIVIDVRENEGQ